LLTLVGILDDVLPIKETDMNYWKYLYNNSAPTLFIFLTALVVGAFIYFETGDYLPFLWFFGVTVLLIVLSLIAYSRHKKGLNGLW
jgi:uncharacterized membrane protein